MCLRACSAAGQNACRSGAFKFGYASRQGVAAVTRPLKETTAAQGGQACTGLASGARQRQWDTRRVKATHEVLVRELHAVDGLAAGAVAVGEVATLAHEVGDDAVEGGALVAQGLAGLADALLACAGA